MNGSAEAFNQKVSLIYEFNNKSPLFARFAEIEIEKNNLDNAINILNEGIKTYSEYSVAYFLLGKIYTLKGDYTQAVTFLKKGSELIHSPKSFEHYLDEIDRLKKQRSFFNISRWTEFANEKFSDNKNSASSQNVNTSSDETIEETLTKLTKEIEGATQSIKEARNKIEESRSKENLNKNLIVSETLAKIYTSQNELQAAISVYKKLIKRNPEKEIYFNSKIEELKSLLKT
ncbi:MAG: tetratricopeptide repeat protein [Ignavibacteriaceae bacterium]